MKMRRAGGFSPSLPLLLLSGCGALKLGVMNHAGPIAASQWHLYVIVGNRAGLRRGAGAAAHAAHRLALSAVQQA